MTDADPGQYADNDDSGDGHDEEALTAYLRVTRVGHTEVGFVRLVPRGQQVPANTFTAIEASVDVDADGDPIGITWFRDV